MNKGKRIGRIMLCLVVSLMMVMTMIPSLPTGMAFAATGDTPPHTKRIQDNQDGTYTIMLDIVGESEKKPNNVNVIVIMDTSGSMTTQRLNAAKNAVNSLANALYAYNTQSEPNTVEMALVQFATSSSIAQQPTNSQTTFTGAVNRLGNAQGQGNGGTNWESALQTANDVSFNDNDQTFVVFVSDGNPTFRTTQNGWNDWSYQYQQWGTGAETTQNIQRCYTTAVDDAVTLATKVTPANFFTIGAFGNVDRMEQLTDDAGSDSSTNYYSAQNTAALNQAISDILAKIEMAGFAEAEIDDGTTSTVTQSSGEVSHLLVVDESSYKYYRTGGDHGTMEPWTDAPEAELVDGTVVWDLSEEGVLENGVRYTVTFDCYPSQETYDIIAQLKNGDITYASLDSEIKKYIVDNGGGSYSLRTNTNAGIKWDDTRDDEGRQESAYINPDPVATDSETLTATKEWEGGDPDVDELDITVLMDDDPFHTATISGPTWATESFISIGIIKNGQVLPGAEGHDFKFAELGGEQYHWELETPTVHPMLIDGTKTMLIMVDDKHEAPSGADTYTIDGKTYYADTSAAGLTAVNHRRSNLNLTKAVTGEDAPKDAKFPFELTVNNSKAPTEAPTDAEDPNHESDYWIWLSVRDENGDGVTGLNMGSGVIEDGGGYYYAPNGTTFSLEIGAGWGLRFLNLPTGTEYEFVEELADGFAFVSAELTQGEDSKFSGGLTTTGTIENTKTSYGVAYTNDYQLTDLEITKVWDDNDDQDGKRPTTDEFKAWLKLMADGTDVTSANASKLTVTEGEDEEGNTIYTAKWTGLTRYAEGEEIEYSVTETPSEDYTADTTTVGDHGTISNSHTPEVTDITVTKAWDDASDQDGKRPDSLTLTLNGAPEGTTVPAPTITESTDGNNWTYTWTGLPKYADGEEIEYTVTEETIPTGYTCDTTTVAAGGTITNSYTPEETTVTVTKVWEDASNQDGKRPEELELTLNGLPEGTEAPTPAITKSGNNWTYTWTGLPKYADGEEIEYTVTEGTVPEGYTCETTTVDAGGTITNTHTPEVTEASVKKVWDDAENQDGIRPQSLVMTLSDGQTVTLNEGNSWEGKITGLPKYAAGVEIEYTWTEGTLPAGYTMTSSTTQGTVTTITNSHTPEQTEATVKKVWEDADDQDGFRPDSITVKLLADGEDTGETVTLNEQNNWTDTIDELDKFKAGKEIAYTWDEGTIAEYTLSKSEKDPADATITTLTNSHTPEKVVVEVDKVWEDADNQDGKRPESVTVKLLADGEDTEKTLVLNEDNEWHGVFEDLDKYAAGEEIKYTVEEVEVPDGYEADVTGNAGSAGEEESDEPEAIGYIVTNTHEPEQIDITVLKVWEDADDQDGFRPDSITIKLLADGEDSGKTVSLNDANEWTNTFTDLYKYKVGAVGQEVVYTIDESEVPEGYEVAIEGTVEDGFTVTNSHTPEVVEISVEKVWDDADDRDGIRPDSVTVTLLADGDDVTQEGIEATVELSEDNDWSYTWEGLNKRAAGVEIAYTVVEEPVPDDYEAEITGDAENGYTIKNFHLANPVPVTIDPPVKKVVKGNPSKDETFTFQMKAVTEGAPMPEGAKDGVMTMDIVGSGEKEFGEAEITEAGTYVYEITEIDTKAANYTYDTTVYTLTVTVEEVADGTQVKLVKTEKVDGGDGTIVFTNTYEEPPAKTGDTTIITPYIVIGVAALILLIMLLFRTRKNRA